MESVQPEQQVTQTETTAVDVVAKQEASLDTNVTGYEAGDDNSFRLQIQPLAVNPISPPELPITGNTTSKLDRATSQTYLQREVKNMKRTQFREKQKDRDRVLENNRLVKNIIQIRKRQSQYKDILENRKDGQNIYTLCGHSRSHIFVNEEKKKSWVGQIQERNNTTPTTAAVLDRKAEVQGTTGLLMKSVPTTNLPARKQEVLRIHTENLRMVQRLKQMKATQNLLGDEYQENYRSRSAQDDEKRKERLILQRYLQGTVTSCIKKGSTIEQLKARERMRSESESRNMRSNTSEKSMRTTVSFYKQETNMLASSLKSNKRRHSASGDRPKTSPMKLKNARFAIDPIQEKDQPTIDAFKKMKKEKLKAEKIKKELEMKTDETMKKHSNRLREVKMKKDAKLEPKRFKLQPLQKILYQEIPCKNPHSYEKIPLQKPKKIEPNMHMCQENMQTGERLFLKAKQQQKEKQLTRANTSQLLPKIQGTIKTLPKFIFQGSQSRQFLKIQKSHAELTSLPHTARADQSTLPQTARIHIPDTPSDHLSTIGDGLTTNKGYTHIKSNRALPQNIMTDHHSLENGSVSTIQARAPISALNDKPVNVNQSYQTKEVSQNGVSRFTSVNKNLSLINHHQRNRSRDLLPLMQDDTDNTNGCIELHEMYGNRAPILTNDAKHERPQTMGISRQQKTAHIEAASQLMYGNEVALSTNQQQVFNGLDEQRKVTEDDEINW